MSRIQPSIHDLIRPYTTVCSIHLIYSTYTNNIHKYETIIHSICAAERMSFKVHIIHIHVYGHTSLSTGNVNFFRGISSGIGHDLTYYNSSTNFTANTGILAEQSIASKGYFLAFSDKRIKKDIV